MKYIFRDLVAGIMLYAGSVSFAQAQSGQSFDQWVEDFKKDAIAQGISSDLLQEAFTGVQPISRVIELDRRQPEGKWTFAQYKNHVISQARINEGRRLYHQHREELEAASRRHGDVPPEVIVALWGIETSYGGNTGGFDVVPALATLAYDGRRSAFFRKELINALKILDQGHIDLGRMKGSWAGAMGQNQFMPSSFFAFAVDGDGDGKQDIWTNLSDVFASTANYLDRSGWREGERWGRPVRIPENFPSSLTGDDIKRSLNEWKGMGITQPNGQPIPVVAGMKASLIVPDGVGGPAFLVYDNFRVFKRWNNSTYFAASVGLLSDAIVQ